MALDKRDLLLRLAEQLRTHRIQARAELDSILNLARSGVPAFKRDSRVDVGAMVDLWRTGASGDEARTVFVLPAGGDTTIDGARPDERFAVVTPASPSGRALLGRRVGEKLRMPLHGEARDWTVVEVS